MVMVGRQTFLCMGGVCLAFHCRRGSWSVLGHLNLREMMRQTTGSYHPKGSSGPGACKNVFCLANGTLALGKHFAGGAQACVASFGVGLGRSELSESE